MVSAATIAHIHAASALITEGGRVYAFTGAGISTPSGIPDFRSPDSGLWSTHDPREFASLTAFRYDPLQFYKWARPLAVSITQAAPNDAHHGLAALEQMGMLIGIVTQNVDGLHRTAGTKNISEIHGHLRDSTCIQCYRIHPTKNMLAEFSENGTVPRCPKCGGILKPNIVLYEEQLPFEPYERARSWMEDADIVIVIGSSLEVKPAGLLPLQALNHGARLIMINQTETYLDERASLILRGDVAQIVPLLLQEVLL